jgi:hypothetical protein
MLTPTQTPDFVEVPTFRNGDSVVLARGPNQGTVGTFLNYRDDDPTWADILGRNSQVTSHPIEWLEHSHQD